MAGLGARMAPVTGLAPPQAEPDPGGEAGGADLKGVARGGALGLVGAGVLASLNLVLVLATTRALPPRSAGVVFATTSLFLIAVGVAKLGTPTGLVYFVVRAKTLGHVPDIRRVLRTGLLPVLVVSLLAATALLIAAPALADVVSSGEPQAAIGPIRLLALFIPVAALADSALAATRGFETMRPLIVVDRIARPVGQVILTIAVIAVGTKSASWFVGAWVLPYLAAAVAGLAWVRHLARRAENRAGAPARAGFSPWGEFWRFTAPRGAQLVVQVALQRLDIVLVAALAGAAEAAVYTAVTRFLVLGLMSQQALTIAVQPRLGALLSAGNRQDAGTVYRVSTGWLVALTWPVYLTMAAYADAIPLLFGDGYQAGRGVLIVLAAAMLFATACGLVDVVQAMGGRTGWTLVNSATALAVDVVLNLLLIPRFGLLGAAIAWACAIVVSNTMSLTQVRLAMRLHPFGRESLVAMAATMTCFGPTAAFGLLASPRLPSLLATSAVATLLYAGILWRFHRVLRLDSLKGSLTRGRSRQSG